MNDLKQKPSIFSATLLVLIFLLLLLDLAATLSGVRIQIKEGAPTWVASDLPGSKISTTTSVEALKQLGLQLKSDRFLDEAADAFEKYLQGLGDKSWEAAAGIYASLAQDYYDASEFRKALVYFYKAEAGVKQLPENHPLKKGLEESLHKDWAAKQMTCLEKLGRTQDADLMLEQKLSNEGGEKDGSPVLAILGSQKLTLKDFNRDVQNLPENAQEQFRKEPKAKKAFFYQWMLNHLLYKKALRLGMDKEPELLEKLENLRRQLLAGVLLEKELGKVEPTLVDLKNYYQSHPHQFTKTGEKEPLPFEEVKRDVAEGFAMQKQNEKAKELMDKLMIEEHVRLFDENVA